MTWLVYTLAAALLVTWGALTVWFLVSYRRAR